MHSLERDNSQLNERVTTLSASAAAAASKSDAAEAAAQRDADAADARIRTVLEQLKQLEASKSALEMQLVEARTELREQRARVAALEQEARSTTASSAAAQLAANEDARVARELLKVKEAEAAAKQANVRDHKAPK